MIPRASIAHDAELTPEETAAVSEPPLRLGECLLGKADVAGLVQEALLHFEGRRYDLTAWCVMPNHVHVVFRPWVEERVGKILHSWKSYTANRANSTLGREGTFWERESFDHLIRRPEHVEWFADYVERNPVVAGLCERPEDWAFSSARRRG